MDFAAAVELLSQPQVEKRVFGIDLVSYLFKKYPIPRTISLVQQNAIGKAWEFGINSIGGSTSELSLQVVLLSLSVLKEFSLHFHFY